MMVTLGVVTMSLVATARPGASSPAQGPEPQTRDISPNEAKAGPTLEQLQAWEREEQLARAREDVEMLEQKLGAKQALLRRAEKALELARTSQANTDRLKKKGYKSGSDKRQAAVNVLDAEAERSLRKADFAEMERRFNRARRRVILLGAPSGTGPGGDEMGIIEAMGRDLEGLKDRMGGMEKKLDGELKDRMGRMEQKLDRLLDETTGVKGRLDRIEAKVFGKK